MKKIDLKKLALMGFAGGIMMASQVQGATTPESLSLETDSLIVFAGASKSSCGGAGGCGGKSSTSHDNGNGNGNGNGASSCAGPNGCGGKPAPAPADNGGNSCAGPNGCGGKPPAPNGGNEKAPHHGFNFQQQRLKVLQDKIGASEQKTGRRSYRAQKQNPNPITETDLWRNLDARGRLLYERMTPEARKLAVEIANEQNNNSQGAKTSPTGWNSSKDFDALRAVEEASMRNEDTKGKSSRRIPPQHKKTIEYNR